MRAPVWAAMLMMVGALVGIPTGGPALAQPRVSVSVGQVVEPSAHRAAPAPTAETGPVGEGS